MDAPVALPPRESLRAELHRHLEQAVLVEVPPGASQDVEEARRRLLGIWPGVLGNWSRLAELGRALDENEHQRSAAAPWWKVLQGYRLAQEESRLHEEQAQHRSRFGGLFESAVDNYAILLEAGARVRFEDVPG